jgi:hypothetical protein
MCINHPKCLKKHKKSAAKDKPKPEAKPKSKAEKEAKPSKESSSKMIQKKGKSSKAKSIKKLTVKRTNKPKHSGVAKKRQQNHFLANAVKIYDDILMIAARKGANSLWPEEDFRHDFKQSKGKASVYGLPDGSILIKGKKKLWKNFNYKRGDI